MFEGRKIRKALAKVLAMEGKPFLWETDKDSILVKNLDGKRYVYCLMNRVSLGYRGDSVSFMFIYRTAFGQPWEHMTLADPRDFLSKVRLITKEELEEVSENLWKEIEERLKVSKWVDYGGRTYEITGHTFRNPYNPFDKESYPKATMRISLKALDNEINSIPVNSPQVFERMFTLHSDDLKFKESEKEYLETKVREFEELKEFNATRYSVGEEGNFKNITRVRVIRTYRYGKNDMYVEYELHHMSEEPDKVEVFTSEFNQFRKKYNLKTVEEYED